MIVGGSKFTTLRILNTIVVKNFKTDKKLKNENRKSDVIIHNTQIMLCVQQHTDDSNNLLNVISHRKKNNSQIQLHTTN